MKLKDGDIISNGFEIIEIFKAANNLGSCSKLWGFESFLLNHKTFRVGIYREQLCLVKYTQDIYEDYIFDYEGRYSQYVKIGNINETF